MGHTVETELLVGMMPPNHAFGGVVHIVHTLYVERNVLEFLQSHQLPTVITMGLEYIFDCLYFQSLSQ